MSGDTSQIEDLLCCERLREISCRWVEEDEIPQPYRQLLCHQRDMTSTLGAFHGGVVSLKVFQSRRIGRDYLREVLLSVGGKPVEYGVILINLTNFPADLRRRILSESEPLGEILNTSGMSYRSSPRGMLEYLGDGFVSDIFPTSSGVSLFGRYNTLLNSDGKILARILEILPRETP